MRIGSPGNIIPRPVVIRPTVPVTAVKIKILRACIYQIIWDADSYVCIDFRRVHKLGSFSNIKFWRLDRHLLDNNRRWRRCRIYRLRRWRRYIYRLGWWRRYIYRLGWWRWCYSYRLGRRGCCDTGAGSRHLVPVGIHALDIGIIISTLGFSAIGLPGSRACSRPYKKPACCSDEGSSSGMAGC
jgi:hypothetical protein